MPLSQEDLKELGQGNEKMSLRQPRIPRTDESKKKKQEQKRLNGLRKGESYSLYFHKDKPAIVREFITW